MACQVLVIIYKPHAVKLKRKREVFWCKLLLRPSDCDHQESIVLFLARLHKEEIHLLWERTTVKGSAAAPVNSSLLPAACATWRRSPKEVPSLDTRYEQRANDGKVPYRRKLVTGNYRRTPKIAAKLQLEPSRANNDWSFCHMHPHLTILV